MSLAPPNDLKKSASENDLAPPPPPKNLGSLLRLFKSCFFDAFIAVTYLHKYTENQGVQDYLCNELYQVPDHVIEVYLPQLCNFILHKENIAIERLILDRCAKSIHLALQCYWFFHACVEDVKGPGENPSIGLRQKTETAAVNGYWSQLPSFLGGPPSSNDSEPHGHLAHHQSVPADLSALLSEEMEDDEGMLEGGDNEDTLSPDSDIFTEEELLSRTRSVGDAPARNSLDVQLPVLVRSTDSQGTSNSIGRTSSVSRRIPNVVVPPIPPKPPSNPPLDPQEEIMNLFLSKQMRLEYFTAEINFFRTLANIGFRLRSVLPADRTPSLRKELDVLNAHLPSGVYLPVCKANAPYARILRIPVEEAVILNSKEKVPYLIYLEVLEHSAMTCSDPKVYEYAMKLTPEEDEAHQRSLARLRGGGGSAVSSPSTPNPPALPPRPNKSIPSIKVAPTTESSTSTRTLPTSASLNFPLPPTTAPTPPSPEKPNGVDNLQQKGLDVWGVSSGGVVRPSLHRHEDLMILQAIKRATSASSKELEEQQKEKNMVGYRFEHQDKVFSESWQDKMQRIKAQSPYGHLPGWRIMSCIIKSGDDCRQEQLAYQLIDQFQSIFLDAKLSVWLRPYAVLVTSAHAALVETVPNAPSLATLKKQTPDWTTLNDYFKKRYGDVNSEAYRIAQNNFIESLAGYSIITYLLQIKDRHNGNILLDGEGHIVHIDFGFMLSNSPGMNINFESAPFKLNSEWVEVMGGDPSDSYDYFKFLCVRGFLEARKHHEKIVLMVEMMRKGIGQKMPCFNGGKVAVDALKDRFCMALTEQQAIEHMLNLINASLDHWRTKQYDNLQRWTNGIL
mmetsp:Transcript_38432/g.62272  ORF Transcript_38432/g.62272 Transcript_38432/m.62272 type:complete len:844 (+) Transcript_38432:152-2683(+)